MKVRLLGLAAVASILVVVASPAFAFDEFNNGTPPSEHQLLA